MRRKRGLAIAAMCAVALSGCVQRRLAVLPPPDTSGERCRLDEILVTGRVVDESTGKALSRALVSPGRGGVLRLGVNTWGGVYRLHLPRGYDGDIVAARVGYLRERRPLVGRGQPVPACTGDPCVDSPCPTYVLNFYMRPNPEFRGLDVDQL